MPPQEATIVQPVEAQLASKELSTPKGVEQHPEAPKIPGYILIHPLGKGAFAGVWRAWQVRTRKFLAVKVFHQQHGVNWLYLQREVERLIRLDKHPNIVSLLDADLTAEPPYYAMDILDGGSLERYVGMERRPPPGAPARWMEEICDALSYVHAKGLLHCDLKPANVLLDEEGRVRVADFGQSRILTETAGALGTLFFMAPEQAVVGENSKDLHPDTRWDIFALGTTLYAVLTGRLPYASQRGRLETAATLRERLAAYQEVVRTVPLEWGEEALEIGEDMVAIVNKCAAPDPAARYESLSAVKADLLALREKRPVSPLAASRAYRTRRFVQRNLPLVALGTAAFVVLAWTGAQMIRARADAVRRLAFSYAMRGRQFSEQGDDASAAAYYAEACRLKPSPLARAAALAHLRQLPVPRRVFPHRWGLRAAALGRDGKTVLTTSWEKGAFLWDTGAERPERRVIAPDSHVTAADLSPDGRLALTAGKDGRVRLWDIATGEPAGELAEHAGEVPVARFSQNGKVILTAGTDRTVRLWDAETRNPLGPEIALEGDVSAVALSEDGSKLAVAAYDESQERGVLQWGQAQSRGSFATLHRTKTIAAQFSPDGRRLASLDKDGIVWVWDLAVAPPKAKGMGLPVQAATCFAFSPDGSRLVTGSAGGEARVWDAQEGLALGPPLPGSSPLNAVAFTSDGRILLAAAEDGQVRLWDAASLLPAGPPLRHSGAAHGLALGAQGRALLTAAGDGTARLWDLPAPSATTASKLSAELPAVPWTIRAVLASLPRDPVDVEFSAVDLRDALAFMGNRAGRILEIAGDVSGTVSLTLRQYPFNEVLGLLLAQNKLEIGRAGDKTLRISSLPLGTESAHSSEAAPSRAPRVAGHPFGLRVLGRQAPAPRHPTGNARGASSLVFSADSAKLLSVQNGVARVWDTASGVPLSAPLDHQDVVRAAFSPDGGQIMTAAADGTVRLWASASGRAAKQFSAPPRQGGEILAAAFNPYGGSLLASGNAGAFHWFWGHGDPLWLKHDALVTALAFSMDGARKATGGADGSVRLWDVKGVWGGRLGGLSDWVSALSFDPAGRWLLAGSWDNTARIWDIPRCQRELLASKDLLSLFLSMVASRGKNPNNKNDFGFGEEEEVAASAKEPACEPSGPPFRHEGEISAAVFDPSGRRFATADWNGTAQIWDAAKGEPVGASLRHAAGISSLAFSPDGQTLLTGSWDGTARLWDAETGEPVWRPVWIGTAVTSIAISRDGRWAAATGTDGVARAWPVAEAAAAATEGSLSLRAQVAGQKRISEKGDVETLPAEELPALRERLASLEGR